MTELVERIPFLPRYEPVRTHQDDERLYQTPVGLCPSVTTVLSGSRDNSGLEAWRDAVGAERADFICSLASHRGTKHHEAVERFLIDGTEPGFCFLQTPYWESTRPFLDTVVTPLLMEGAVWHPEGYAGTLDCVAYLSEDGLQPTLLDWKTADSPRKPDKIYEYSLQCAAYVKAVNYVYGHLGLKIEQAKIVIAIADQLPQIETLDSKALSQLYKHFLARLKRFTYARKRRRKRSNE